MRKKVIPPLVLSIITFSFLGMMVQKSIDSNEVSVRDPIFVEVSPLRGENQTYSRHTNYNNKYYYDKIEQNTQVAGFGSSIIDSKVSSDITVDSEGNDTRIWIVDPTGQIDGYYIDINSSYQELNASRGQTYQHYYNTSSNEYSVYSSSLVNKTGIIDNTDWVTAEEYPTQFIIRLTDGSIITSSNLTQISNYLSSLDNTTIWAVGIEGIAGVMAFYLNFADFDWGHGQYLYYPRLLNGQLPNFNQPLYAIYPHLFAKLTGTWYDKILNDRSLYQGVVDPRNTLHTSITDDTFELYYTTYGITIMGRIWDFKHGFKFNLTDQLFHQITEFRCRNQDFEDVGMGYEITSSPQSDGTPYQPDHFLLSNETDELSIGIAQAWQAGIYLEDFYSRIEIISENNETMVFTFSDMEDAGFTQKYLELHDQLMPDGSTRKTLLAGMYGFGAYSVNTIIEIDPVTGTKYSTDDSDLYIDGSTWRNVDNFIFNGYYNDADEMRSFIAFNTGITTVVLTTSDEVIQWRFGLETMEATEAVWAKAYNIRGNYDSNTAKESSNSYSDTAYYGPNRQIWLDGDDASGYSIWRNDDSIIDDWMDNREAADNYISIRMWPIGADPGENDRIGVYDQSFAGNAYAPKMSFTYTVPNTSPVCTIDAYPSGDQYAGIAFSATMTGTDADGQADLNIFYMVFGDTAGGTNSFRLYYDSDNFVDDTQFTALITVNTASPYKYSATGIPNSITNGWQVVWTLVVKFGYAYYDDGGAGYNLMDVWALVSDDSAASSSWKDEQSAADIEDDLEAVSLTVSYPDAYEYGGTASQIDDSDWFAGGHTATASGSIEYEGFSQTFDSDYDAGDGQTVQLWFNAGDLGDVYDDADIDAGAYSIAFTPTAGTDYTDDTIDADCDWDVTIQGSTGSDVTAAGIAIESSRDNEYPDTTFSSITENAPHTYIYYPGSGQTVYFSDLMGATDQLFTVVVTASDGSGSDIYAVSFSAWDDEVLWDDTTDPYSRQYSTDSTESVGSINIYAKDNVGNADASAVTITMTEDLVDPTLTDAMSGYSEGGDVDEIFGVIADNEAFFSDSFDTDGTMTFTATGTDGGAGVRGIDFGSFGADNPAEDTESPYTGLYTINDDDSTGSITVVIYDNVGNDASGSITMTEDAVAPTVTITWNFNDNDWAIMSGSDYGWTNIDYTVVQDTASGLQTVYLNSYDHSASAWKTARTIASGLNGDTSSKSYLDQYRYHTDTGETTGTYVDDEYDNTQDKYYAFADDMVGNRGGTEQYIRLDRTAPTGHSVVMESGTFYADITNDNTPLLTGSDASDSGSGLSATPYYFAWRVNGGGWSNSGYQAGNTWSPTVTVSSIDYDFTLQIQDVVGNTGVYANDYENTVDLIDPAFTNIGGSESSGYLYAVGATIDNGYYSDNMGATPTNFLVIGDVTDNFGLEKANGSLAFSDTPDDTSITGTSDSFSLTYTITSGYSGAKVVTLTLYDQAGNSVQATYTFYEDNIPPESNVIYTNELYNSGIPITVSNLATDSGSGIRTTDGYEWWVNQTRIYGTQFTTSNYYTWNIYNLTNLVFYGAVYDNVMNFSNATTKTVIYIFILIITSPQPEIEEIETTEYYNDEDVYLDDTTTIYKIINVDYNDFTSVEEYDLELEENIIMNEEINVTEKPDEIKTVGVIKVEKIESITNIRYTIGTICYFVMVSINIMYNSNKKRRRR
ncbi:hypothetical protein CEE45_01475 [Candidatus Heimdallarchaeota archaeon B3_Heim]|nr:MAG: hypothetical protein CEE45_01475 [Candidatus Heimdallarchaeota archaeon B3_Heim]